MRIDKYEIHKNGTIKNINTGRFLKPQNNGNGYFKVTLTIEGKQIQRYVHRLVAEAYLDKPEWANQVNHIDGDKSNNDCQNLEWTNNSLNQIHAHRNGLKPNGNKLWNGKFSKEQIMDIKSLSKSGVKGVKIAEIYNCSKGTISEILNNKRYQYV